MTLQKITLALMSDISHYVGELFHNVTMFAVMTFHSSHSTKQTRSLASKKKNLHTDKLQ